MTATKDLVIRDARDPDMGSIQAIYAHHVRHGLASWEETPSKTRSTLQRLRVAKASDRSF